MMSEIKIALILGVAITAAVVAISGFFSYLEETEFEAAEIIQDEKTEIISIDKSKYKKAPDLAGIAYYLNTTPEQLQEKIDGKVVLYDIWTYSCINCVRTLPYITAWNDKYSEQGLLIIGIHSPEFEFEKNVENVKAAISKYGITYPVVMDNDWETWKAFENRYWPRKYIADHEGYIRYDHIGEGAYEETEKVIQQLLKERAVALGIQTVSAEPLVDIEEFEHTAFRTPELYFGYKLAQGRNQLGNQEGFKPNEVVRYSDPKKINLHNFYMVGDWENLPEKMALVSDTGSIKILYHAKEVNIVTANNAEIEIFLDGMPLPPEYAGNDVNGNTIHVNEAALYNIISSKEPATHELELQIKTPGFEIFTFTFG